MDSDDDLPPPPPRQAPQKVIQLDDSDDDLPPPSAPPAASPKVIVNLDDDDDLPPPPNATSSPPPSAPPPSAPQTNVIVDDGQSKPPPLNDTNSTVASPDNRKRSQVMFADPGSPATPASPPPTPATESSPVTPPSGGRGRARSSTVAKMKLYLEGFLQKQQPTWPYMAQLRWCVLANRQLSYYESKGTTKPSGVLPLKDATFRTTDLGTTRPYTFGVEIPGEGHSTSARTYIFSAQNAEDFDSWCRMLEGVCGDANRKVAAVELHWFEKMAQGIY